MAPSRNLISGACSEMSFDEYKNIGHILIQDATIFSTAVTSSPLP